MFAPAVETYPEPVAFCDICALNFECVKRRRTDDHLSFVAGARRDHRDKLELLGHRHARPACGADERDDLGPPERHRLRHAAPSGRASAHDARHEAPDTPPAGAGRRPWPRAAPDPSAGDVFFDLEGDPYADP